MNWFKVLSMSLLLFGLVVAQQKNKQIYRLMDEGTFNIPATNGLANGNLKLYTQLTANVSNRFIQELTLLGGSIGIGGIIKLDLNTSFVDFNSLGPSSVHLTITTPNNDKLRFFGLALSGDVYLSSSIDTIGENANSTKPVFNPYPLFSVVTDFDWISQKRHIPLKTYLMFSLSDNPKVLFEYREFSTIFGAEWKNLKNSIFLDLKYAHYTGRYKNKTTGIADKEYYLGIYPGGRYRIGKRLSLVGSIGFNIVRNFKDNSSADPGIFTAGLKLNFPLIYKESDAEAVRDMIYMDKKRESTKKSSDIKKPSAIDQKELLGIDEDGVLDMDDDTEELIQKRKKVEDKMKEIEELLNDEN